MSPASDAALARLESALGRELLMTDPAYVKVFAIDGRTPAVVIHPTTAEQVQESVRLCAAEGLAIIPLGWRSQKSVGGRPSAYDVAITLREMDKLTVYDPGDLTLACQAGMKLEDLQTSLRAHNQFLPLESECGDLCTVGGTLAANASGPLRYSYGTARDFLLGMEFVTGDGKLCKSGTRVVKSVAGYDLHKLLLGSLGSLGVIVSANFRTFPIPPAKATFVVSFADLAAALAFLSAIRRSPLQPRALDLVSPEAAEWAYSPDPEYCADPLPFPLGLWSIALAIGAKPEVMERHRRDCHMLAAKLGAASFSEPGGEHEDGIWRFIEDLTRAETVLDTATTVIKVTLLPQMFGPFLQKCAEIGRRHDLPCMSLLRAASTIYVQMNVDDVKEATLLQVERACTELCAAAEQSCGHAVIRSTHAEVKKRIHVWGVPREDFALMQRVKQVFDPHTILSPGRFVGGL